MPVSFSSLCKAQNPPDALNGPFLWSEVDLSWEGLTIFIRGGGLTKDLVAIWKGTLVATWGCLEARVGPVQDTLLITPVSHKSVKSLFEG